MGQLNRCRIFALIALTILPAPAAAQYYHLFPGWRQNLVVVPPTTFPGPAWPAERVPDYDQLVKEQRRLEMPPSQWREEAQQRVDRILESMKTQSEDMARERREIDREYRIRALERRLDGPFR